MADITVTGSADFGKVTAGIKRLGAESATMTKKSGRAGMAILDLSRGIEDFAVAGMRGAANNIPGFIMSLGAGAGVAGAASLAAVAIMTLGKRVGELQERMNAAREKKLFGDGWFDWSGIETDTKKVMDEITRQVEAGAANVRDAMADALSGDKKADLLAMSSAEPRFLGLPTLDDIRQMQALVNANAKAFNDTVSKMRIDGNGMLSSQGRIGGSGKEFQASIATINWQRETISSLKKIERNTRSRASSYQ